MPPAITSEKRTRPSPIQARPAAFFISRVGEPPVTGTVQVSQELSLGLVAVEATRVPSGVKTGLYFRLGSLVISVDWPSGSRSRHRLRQAGHFFRAQPDFRHQPRIPRKRIGLGGLGFDEVFSGDLCHLWRGSEIQGHRGALF